MHNILGKSVHQRFISVCLSMNSRRRMDLSRHSDLHPEDGAYHWRPSDTNLARSLFIYFFPVVNPDGYVYTDTMIHWYS